MVTLPEVTRPATKRRSARVVVSSLASLGELEEDPILRDALNAAEFVTSLSQEEMVRDSFEFLFH
jgi:hypothetical protein